MQKIITLSFDDGVTQDKKWIELLKKYKLTCTFNLNSALLGKSGELAFPEGVRIPHNKVRAEEVAELYRGFEVAAHTRTHPMLTHLSPADIAEQVIGDYLKLSELTGYPVRGMAYPGGAPNYDRLAVEVIGRTTNIRYARTIDSTHQLNFPQNYLLWHPSAHILSDATEGLIERFSKAEQDSLLYLWGHSYEFDWKDGWARAEAVLSRLAEQVKAGARCLTNMQVCEEFANRESTV